MTGFENDNPEVDIKDKFAMLTGVTHELSTALVTFLGYCELEREKVDIPNGLVMKINMEFDRSQRILNLISKASSERDMSSYKELCRQNELLLKEIKHIGVEIEKIDISGKPRIKETIQMINEVYISVFRPLTSL